MRISDWSTDVCSSDLFAKVEVGDWGHSLAWPSGAELGADMLWLETLLATGHGDVRAFLEGRLRHALSLSKAADALGVSRRMVAYYSNGEKQLANTIRLACPVVAAGKGPNRAAHPALQQILIPHRQTPDHPR